MKSSTSNRVSLVIEDQRQQITCILSMTNKEEREKQSRSSQVLGSMPYFRVVTFRLPLDSCVIRYWQTWQIHVPMDQNPYFSPCFISQTSLYCGDLIVPPSGRRIVCRPRRVNYCYYRALEDDFLPREVRFYEGMLVNNDNAWARHKTERERSGISQTELGKTRKSSKKKKETTVFVDIAEQTGAKQGRAGSNLKPPCRPSAAFPLRVRFCHFTDAAGPTGNKWISMI